MLIIKYVTGITSPFSPQVCSSGRGSALGPCPRFFEFRPLSLDNIIAAQTLTPLSACAESDSDQSSLVALCISCIWQKKIFGFMNQNRHCDYLEVCGVCMCWGGGGSIFNNRSISLVIV